MNKPQLNPPELARETLKTLALRKIPPTPGNYASIYSEIAGTTSRENYSAEKVLKTSDHPKVFLDLTDKKASA
ncbi:MAG: hypothetical protein OEV15_02245 [Gallionella sp.]|nr:hypothetical protein [Gallionella sp.]